MGLRLRALLSVASAINNYARRSVALNHLMRGQTVPGGDAMASLGVVAGVVRASSEVVAALGQCQAAGYIPIRDIARYRAGCDSSRRMRSISRARLQHREVRATRLPSVAVLAFGEGTGLDACAGAAFDFDVDSLRRANCSPGCTAADVAGLRRVTLARSAAIAYGTGERRCRFKLRRPLRRPPCHLLIAGSTGTGAGNCQRAFTG
jgi:hypothetical protein